MTEYTVEELKEFASGVSLRLCSLRSAEYWGGKYTEQIRWLEQLYAKVRADISEKERINEANH